MRGTRKCRAGFGKHFLHEGILQGPLCCQAEHCLQAATKVAEEPLKRIGSTVLMRELSLFLKGRRELPESWVLLGPELRGFCLGSAGRGKYHAAPGLKAGPLAIKLYPVKT